MRNTQDDILTNMVALYRYFKNLTPENLSTYKGAKSRWMTVAQAIKPEHYTSTCKEMSAYFTQTENYTPIRLSDGQSLI